MDNVSAEIICVGTELILGDVLDTNSQFLSKELALMGINVYYRSTVGDNVNRLKSVVEIAKGRSNLIIFTGGLGPTKDDLTVKTVAEVFGIPLVENKEAVKRMRAYFEKLQRPFSENNLSQALVPEGATVFQNENGTAPGNAFKKDGITVIFLPGPPREMKMMFEKSVRPFLEEYCGGRIRSHFVNLFGISESRVDEITEDLQNSSNPTVAPYAKNGECYLRVTAKAETEEDCEKLCNEMIEKIKARLRVYIYGIDVDSLQQTVVDLLKSKNLTVATAESVTAGYISKRITEIAGASEVFTCGAVTYSNEIKSKMIGVSEKTLNEQTAVSEDVAKQMAKGVRLLSGCNIGLSITGYAGPKFADEEVGLCYIGLSDEKGEYVIRVRKGDRNDREYVRFVMASEALNLLRRYAVNYPNEFNSDIL